MIKAYKTLVMIRKITFTALFGLIAIQAYTQVTTTTLFDGDFELPGNWDNGVPGASDTAIVAHSMIATDTNTVADLRISATGAFDIPVPNKFTATNLCQIDANGSLNSDGLFVCNGDYVLNGTHSGAGVIRLGNGGNISGTGSCTTTNKISVTAADRVILAGSDLDFSSIQFTLFDAITVTNNGEVEIDFLKGQSAGETWVNNADAILNVNTINTSILLDAAANGNLVSLNNSENIATDVPATVTGEYYDLTITGDGIKRLRGDITIQNDLNLNGTAEMQVIRSGIIYDVTIQGDWINNGGSFAPSAGNVSFTGSNQTISIASGTELFHNLNFFNTDTITQNGDIVLINDLTFTSTYDLAGNTTTLVGDFVNSGTFLANEGVVSMSGFGSQNISGNTTFYDLTINNFSSVSISSGTSEVFGTLLLANGNFSTNDSLIIGSDATNTGRIGTVTGGSISGDVTVERYFDPLFQGWHQLGMATSGGTLEDWDDDFITTGFTGSNYPGFPFVNIVSYVETTLGGRDSGLIGVSNITDAVGIGEGRRIYLDNEPMEIETKGPVHTGSFTFTVTYTADMGTTEDGWNLVANPYASSIDWDGSGWTKTDVNDAIYVWDGDLGLYNSYIGGVATNGGSNIVPSSQAFWIQTNDDTTNPPELIVSESDKSTSGGTFKNLMDIDIMNIYVDDGVNKDQIAIVVREGATLGFDGNYDAHKLYTQSGIPNLASIATDGIELSINSIPELNNDVSIPIKIVAEPGQYSIRTFDDIELPPTSCAIIEDLFTGESMPLSTNIDFPFNWSDDNMIEPRFIIHMTATAEFSSINETCVGLNDGSATVLGTQDGPWDYTWYDANGQVILEENALNGASSIENLGPGTYSVEIVGASSCGNNSLEFDIFNAHDTEFDLLNTTIPECNVESEGTIEVELFNPNESIQWTVQLLNSQNELISTQESYSGIISYSSLIADEYTFIASNDCDSFEEILDLTDPEAVVADFSSNLEVINLSLGQNLQLTNNSSNAENYMWDFGDGLISDEVNPIHTYVETGVYTVSLNSSNPSCTDSKTMEVEVIDEVVGLESLDPNSFNIYLNENNQISINCNTNLAGPIVVEIRNYTGQLVFQHSLNNINELTLLPQIDVPESIYMISLIGNGEILTTQKMKLN